MHCFIVVLSYKLSSGMLHHKWIVIFSH